MNTVREPHLGEGIVLVGVFSLLLSVKCLKLNYFRGPLSVVRRNFITGMIVQF